LSAAAAARRRGNFVVAEALTGTEVLASIERLLEEARRELEAAAARLAAASQEHERLRQAELGVLGVLARVRLKEIERGEVLGALDETGKRVKELLARRADALAAVGTELKNAQDLLAALEQERAVQHARVEAAEKSVDTAEADAQKRLGEDASYRAQLERAQASDAVADLSEAKAESARADRTQKGKPYEDDPLFFYLWSRGYGTSRYRSGSLSRLLDRWVARVVDFEPLRRNYWMLTELPARFDEHAKRMRAAAEVDVVKLRELEREAAVAAGVADSERALAAETEALSAIDARITQREAEIAALVAKRGAFAAGEDDLSRQCTQVLGDAFRTQQMRALRERANRTPGPEDDAAVDELTVIRADLPRVVEDVARQRELHESQRNRSEALEEVRKRFKEQRFDAVASEFVNAALLRTLLTQLVSGTLGVGDFWDALVKQQRFGSLSADPRFGSAGFPRSGGGPWRLPGGAAPGGKGVGPRSGGFGGFGTGGGFGRGGGFKSGGGF
jgi:hypothetical protein